MSYAIRFRPLDPADVSPALYLSVNEPSYRYVPGDGCALVVDPAARRRRLDKVTSLPVDVAVFHLRDSAVHYRLWSAPLLVLAERERLRADVVPLADALADLAT